MIFSKDVGNTLHPSSQYTLFHSILVKSVFFFQVETTANKGDEEDAGKIEFQ